MLKSSPENEHVRDVAVYSEDPMHPTAASLSAPKPTLFLDFDGVLHPNLARPEQRFERMPLLAQALEGTELHIIISSSWRFEWSLSRLIGLFPTSLQSRVAGTTGQPYIGRHARWNEITACCTERGITNWRALDDAHFEFPNPCERLIRCEGSRGLGQEQCNALVAWLKEAV